MNVNDNRQPHSPDLALEPQTRGLLDVHQRIPDMSLDSNQIAGVFQSTRKDEKKSTMTSHYQHQNKSFIDTDITELSVSATKCCSKQMST